MEATCPRSPSGSVAEMGIEARSPEPQSHVFPKGQGCWPFKMACTVSCPVADAGGTRLCFCSGKELGQRLAFNIPCRALFCSLRL